MRIGTQELIIILIVVIIIFGPTQIPKLTKMFGKSVKGFKEGMEETEEDAPEVSKKVKKAKGEFDFYYLNEHRGYYNSKKHLICLDDRYNDGELASERML